MVFCNFEGLYIWLADYHIRVTSSEFIFCFRVSKGSRDWKSSWKNSYWTYYIVWIYFVYLISALCLTSSGGSLINLATSCYYSLVFILIGRLMILT
jgi:hypothetical protein